MKRLSILNKKGGKDQESIQSSTTPDLRYHMGKTIHFRISGEGGGGGPEPLPPSGSRHDLLVILYKKGKRYKPLVQW